MASTPSNPVPPNDPNKLGPKGPSKPQSQGPDPTARPAASPDTDWLSEIEAMATPGPRKFEPDPDDAELDLRALFEDAEDSGPPSFSTLGDSKGRSPLPGEPDEAADILLGHGDPIAPASGWLDVPPSNIIPKPPGPANTHEEDSHIFTLKTGPATGGSDVLRVTLRPTPSSSNIFDAPPGGSSRFSTPLDGTEKNVGQDVPELLSTGESSSVDVFDSTSNAANQLMNELKLPFPSIDSDPRFLSDDSRPDFNRTDRGSSGSNLFSDVTEADIEIRDSGVDLLHPDTDADQNLFTGPGSSIFGARLLYDEHSQINVDEIPLMSSSDDKTDMMMFTGDDLDGTSHIFQGGSPGEAGGSSVSFNLPGRGKEARPVQDTQKQESGEIDWTLPAEGMDPNQISQRMSAEEADEAGIPDLHALASQMDASGEMPAPLSSDRLESRRSGLSGVTQPRRRSDGSRSDINIPTAWATEPAPAKKGSGGWFGGTAIGLIAGVAACAGVYMTGVIPSGSNETKSVATTPPSVAAPNPQAPTGVVGLADARAMLASGDVALALPALEAVGENAPVDIVAERGKARWITRVRELANSGQAIQADDTKLVAAVADLQAIVDSKEPLKTDAEKQIAVESALRLGLTKELANDIPGAIKIYSDAATRFPAAKQVFQTSLNRLKAMQANGTRASLTPRQAHELAEVATVSLLLFQADVPDAKKPTTDEPGFLFWDAITQATAQQYSTAIASIIKAKAAHNDRRLKNAGRGLNPLSDPLEQIFLRTCDDLKDYWSLRQQLYGHPTAGPLFTKSGIPAGLDSLTKLAKSDDTLMPKITELTSKLKAAMDEATTAGTQKETALKELTDAKETIKIVSKEHRDLRDQNEQAAIKLAQSEALFSGLVSTLKTNKLVDEKDDTATIMKNLPAVLRKLAAASSSTDATKAAEALLAAKKDVDAAQLAAKTADDKVKAVEIQMTAATVKAEKQLQQANAVMKELEGKVAMEAKKATDAAAAQTAMMKQLEDAKARTTQELVALRQQNADLVRQRQQVEKTAALQLEDLDRRVANARSGISVPLNTSESIARDRAVAVYNSGIQLYFANRFSEAEAEFAKATQADPNDARYWYFLGLARYAQGNPDAAEAYKRGAECESRNQPNARDINAALERVPRTAKQTLAAYRP